MSRISWLAAGALGVVTLGAAACSAGNDGNSNTTSNNNGGGNNTGGGSGGIDITTAAGGSGGAPSTCTSDPAVDDDLDGFTDDQGDCNDCDPNVNPGAVEVAITEPDQNGNVPEPADEDCDTIVDNVAPPCDDGIALDDFTPMNGARAIGICKDASAGGYGVVSAAYTRANGTPLNPVPHIGIQTTFGSAVNAQEGTRMLAISSGTARTPGQPSYVHHDYQGLGGGTAPPGFPQDVPSCAGQTNINDDVGLDLTLRAPTNATGYSFGFKFYSYEFPEYVCTQFNDQFIALVTPPPTGSINGNISFDSGGNPVSVNIAFFDVCNPASQGNFGFFSPNPPPPPNPYCPSGTGELAGTGFDQDCPGCIFPDTYGLQGGTSWLQTTAPIAPGEQFQIRFAIWDTGDMLYDSTTLIDAFEWIANGGTVGVGTTPVPTPK